MKNNLKKAISAVIALAIAGSMVPATLAAKVNLTDVPATADYATAVNALVALNIVNGYEDDSFKPDNLITRAEASKIVVAALNETEAAEGMKGATKFSDIEAKHEWATGYINKGVSMQYIDGDNGKFDPDGNVTYAQMLKMMLCAMGYKDHAASLAEINGYTGSNWYVPFTNLAEETEIDYGVSANPNDAITRAQVAQIVYNAIKAPIVKNAGVGYTDSGKPYQKVKIQNGEGGTDYGEFYRSILTEDFDAYFVEGYVKDIAKGSTTLKADEINFAVAKSQKYAEDDVQKTVVARDFATAVSQGVILNNVNVGDTDAGAQSGVYSTAILAKDEYDDWSVLYFVPSGKNKTVKFNLKDYDDSQFGGTYANWTTIKGTVNSELKFIEEGARTSTKYPLATTVKVFVNGVEIADTNVESTDPIWNYVVLGDIGEVELVDTYKTDGKYDTIYVDYYYTGKATYINGNDGEVRITDGTTNEKLILNPEVNKDVDFTIYYNGEEISVGDLKKDDILTVAYNVKNGDPEISDFYEIYVSRDVVTGTLMSKNDDEFEAKIGENVYEFAKSSKYTAKIAGATLGDEWKFYLDAFGRVYEAEINSSAANWGIATRIWYTTNENEAKITFFTGDGVAKTYTLDIAKLSVDWWDQTANSGAGDQVAFTVNSNKSTAASDLAAKFTQAATAVNDYKDVKGDASTTTTIGGKEGVPYYVANYKVSASTGKVTKLSFQKIVEVSTTDEYRTRNNSIGSIKLGDATKIVDAINYNTATEELASVALSSLVAGVQYKAYAYGAKIDGVHPFVMITAGEAAYGEDTRFAVVTGSLKQNYESGEEVLELEAMYGNETSLILADDCDVVGALDVDDLQKGDVIFFKTNAKGYVSEIDLIFSAQDNNSGVITVPTHAQLAAASLKNGNMSMTGLTDTNTTVTVAGTRNTGNFSADFTKKWYGVESSPAGLSESDAIRYVYGPIVEIKDNDIAFGKISSNKTDLDNKETDADGIVIYELDANANTYSYDYANGEKWRFEANKGVEPSDLVVDANNVIDWTDQSNKNGVNFAFAIVHDDVIVDIFTFVAP